MTDFLKLDQFPIHQAAVIGNIAALADLIAAGHKINARIDAVDDWGIFCCGLTPLMLAACSPRGATVDTLRWLIDHGADITLCSTGNVTAAWYAAGNGVFFLQTSDDVPAAEQVERLRLLLQLGADPHETADNGRSLLVEACRAGDPMRVALLLEQGVSPEPVLEAIAPRYRRQYRKSVSPLSQYQIPLFCSVRSGSADCVQLLITAGADVNRQADNGAIALMYASNPDTMQVLLDAGADVTAIRQRGWDAFQEILGFESENEQEEADIVRSLQLLIQQGVDINATQRGANRFYQAAFGRNPLAIQRLLKLGATSTAWRPLLSALTWHCSYEFDEDMARCIELLVAAGADVNAKDSAGNTLLHNATLEYSFPSTVENFLGSSDGCNYTAVHCLLKYGVNPDPVGTRGKTPLMLAAAEGCELVVHELLRAGAKPTRKDDHGRTALDIARQAYETWKNRGRDFTSSREQENYQGTLQAKANCLRLLQQWS